jgi:hypothetical protein
MLGFVERAGRLPRRLGGLTILSGVEGLKGDDGIPGPAICDFGFTI